MFQFPPVIALAIIITCSMATPSPADEPDTVKVFILAGQSNMEGKAKNSLLEFQATDPKTKQEFAHLRKDGQWIVRDDAFIKYLNRNGGLTIGFGSPNKTGVELEFGNVMADHFDEPVLLIKTAWGGHSLYQKFRSPSAGMPSDAEFKTELEKAQQRVKNNNEKNNQDKPLPTMDEIKAVYGSSYRNMMSEIHETFQNYETMFPSLKGKKLELVGFVWFQGYNDMFGDAAPGEYATNMKHFIHDVRNDLGVPHLPFVIGALGQNGSKPATGGMLTVANAQMSMNDIPEFKGNVIAIRTDLLIDQEADRVFPNWKDHVDEWEKVGSDRPYHYLGSAIWFNRIGKSFGNSMLELINRQE